MICDMVISRVQYSLVPILLQFCCLGMLSVGDVSAHHTTLHCCSCNNLPQNLCYDMQQLDVHSTLASAAGDSTLHSYMNP